MQKNQIIRKYLRVDVFNLDWKNENTPRDISFELAGVFKSENCHYYSVDSYSDLSDPGAKTMINKIQECDQDGYFDSSDFLYLVKEIFLPNQTMGSGITLKIFDVTTEKIKEIRKMKLRKLYS
jgi:hypothetical protein